MNIVHVISGLSNGGAEAVLYRLIKHERKHTHFVISLSNKDTFYQKPLEQLGVKVRTINLREFRNLVTFPFWLANYLSKNQATAVQAWMYHAALFSWLASVIHPKTKLYWSLHATTLSKRGFPLSTIILVRMLSSFSHFKVSKIVYCSNSSLNLHKSYGYANTASKLIYNGIDTGLFKPRPRSESENQKFTIGHVSRYHPMKDTKNLLEAASILKTKFQFELHLYGPGYIYGNNELTELIQKYGVEKRVRLFGPKANIHLVYPEFDIFVLSSAYGESLPNVLSEAMSCGVPCVTTDVGDSNVIVGNFGWTAPISDSSSLAHRIHIAFKEFSNAPKAWAKRKSNCRNRIKKMFSINEMISEYSNVWETK